MNTFCESACMRNILVEGLIQLRFSMSCIFRILATRLFHSLLLCILFSWELPSGSFLSSSKIYPSLLSLLPHLQTRHLLLLTHRYISQILQIAWFWLFIYFLGFCISQSGMLLHCFLNTHKVGILVVV